MKGPLDVSDAEHTKPRLSLQDLCDLRGIAYDDVCPHCSGFGVRAYGSTSTWRGGIGGQAVTRGVCDKCWGSGSFSRPGANLRRFEALLRNAKP